MNFLKEKIKIKFKNKKAQSAFELAVIFPLICIILLYFCDLMRYVNAKMDIMLTTRNVIRSAQLTLPSSDMSKSPVYLSTIRGLNLLRETATPGLDTTNENIKVNVSSSANINKLGTLMSAEICGNLQLSFPSLWPSSQNGKIQICQKYYGKRSVTNDKY